MCLIEHIVDLKKVIAFIFTANGVTWNNDGSRSGACYAEFEQTGVSASAIWDNCQIQPGGSSSGSDAGSSSGSDAVPAGKNQIIPTFFSSFPPRSRRLSHPYQI